MAYERVKPRLESIFVNIIYMDLQKERGDCSKVATSSSRPWPIPVAVRSKAWSFGRSHAGTAGSNRTYATHVSVLRMLGVW